MKRSPRLYSITCLLLLCAVSASARRDTLWHDFDELNIASKITFTGTTYAETADVNYTCATSAQFGSNSSDLCAIIANKNGSSVTTSPAMDNLCGLIIYHHPGAKCDELQIRLSRDGSSWTALTTDNVEYGYGVIYVNFSRRSYQVQLRNTDTYRSIAIYKIGYITEECNCFEYIPE